MRSPPIKGLGQHSHITDVQHVRIGDQRNPGSPRSKCTDLLDGCWTPEVFWSLSEAPRRVSELRRDSPFISAKVMTSRLRDLEQRGVLTRKVMPTSPSSVEYELADLGKELLPAIRSIVEVGSRCSCGNLRPRRSGTNPSGHCT
ncbi:winged helix-turn-helix transcriptional regulator [Rhizobium sp. No.120]